MVNLRTNTDAQLPSFSIVLETENLANADLEGLSRCLNSLVSQEPSPACANEVLIIDSGDTPSDLLAQIRSQYPWITVHLVNPGTDYYEAKMIGAAITTGEVVVYCDSDCIYDANWLRNILVPFSQNADIDIVAGETITRGEGVYGVAMGLNYIFPRYTNKETLSKSSHYFLNNVAFRREFLLQHPIPTELKLYRGNCGIHAKTLCKQGYIIWRQPQAKATHAPPEGLSHFFWRFLLMGHDHHLLERILETGKDSVAVSGNSGNSPKKSPNSESSNQSARRGILARITGKSQVIRRRASAILSEDPGKLIYFPLAIPVAFAAQFLIFLGRVITSYNADFLLTVYNQIESKSKDSQLKAAAIVEKT